MSTAGAIVTAVLALAGSGTAAALVKSLFDRRRIVAEADKAEVDAVAALSETALSLLDPLRAQIADLRTQLVAAQARIRELQQRLDHYEPPS